MRIEIYPGELTDFLELVKKENDYGENYVGIEFSIYTQLYNTITFWTSDKSSKNKLIASLAKAQALLEGRYT